MWTLSMLQSLPILPILTKSNQVFDSILKNQQEDRLAFMLETSNTSEVLQ